MMKSSATYNDLLAGVKRFQAEVHPQKQELFSVLANGQQPHVTFLTCSDSRIDPCAMTQSDPGDLFVIRNAGNIVPTTNGGQGGELATLEFAVKVLGTKHIVVCGHSDCGAMKGLLAPEKCAHLEFVSAWVREALPALADVEDEALPAGEQLSRVIDSNVKLQLENLRRLDFIREAEKQGELELHGWVYEIGSGVIRMLSEGQDQAKMQMSA